MHMLLKLYSRIMLITNEQLTSKHSSNVSQLIHYSLTLIDLN